MIQANCQWENAPEALSLERDVVHLWRLYVPAAVPRLEQLAACLTLAERERAGRYKVCAPRDSFVIGRSVLRILLGRYTHTSPQNITIGYNSFGKPYLDVGAKGSALTFNLSHSGDWLVYAFARSRMLGVDIEYHRKAVRSEEIARRFFAPDELRLLLRFEGDARRRMFYQLWVRKEACLKAMGSGLARSLRDLQLPMVEGAAVLFRHAHFADSGGACWLYPFTIAEDYSCALVSCPPPGAVRHFHWGLPDRDFQGAAGPRDSPADGDVG